jgi:hypothetical protein
MRPMNAAHARAQTVRCAVRGWGVADGNPVPAAGYPASPAPGRRPTGGWQDWSTINSPVALGRCRREELAEKYAQARIPSR